MYRNRKLRERWIRKIVVDAAIPQKVVEAVLRYEFEGVVKATETCDSIEISGFGRLMFYEKKAHKLLKKYNEQIELFEKVVNGDMEDISPQRRNALIARLDVIRENRAILKKRIG